MSSNFTQKLNELKSLTKMAKLFEICRAFVRKMVGKTFLLELLLQTVCDKFALISWLNEKIYFVIQ